MSTNLNTNASQNLARTRRNVVAMGSILASSILSGCKVDQFDNRTHQHNKRDPNCYLRGTRILAACGPQKVEELNVGDLVNTVDGGMAPILWIARRSCSTLSTKRLDPEFRPIRIAQGALGANVPHADLFVSAGHRILLDGVLVRIADLRNGTSIDFAADDVNACLEYFHILLAKHNVILAEGLACETLLITEDTLAAFDNVDELNAGFAQAYSFRNSPCAPLYADLGGRARFWSHFRNALSPWLDFRNKVDEIRDRLLLEHSQVGIASSQ